MAWGLALSGRLAAGKSSAQRILVESHGFWSPTTITTRRLDPGEDGVSSVPTRDFVDGVGDGRYALPVCFAGNWYAWSSPDVSRLLHHSTDVALNLRPYTALALSALVPDLLPVWLRVREDELIQRRARRGSNRDRDPKLGDLRSEQDRVDAVYEPLFRIRVESNARVIPALLAIHEGHWK